MTILSVTGARLTADARKADLFNSAFEAGIANDLPSLQFGHAAFLPRLT